MLLKKLPWDLTVCRVADLGGVPAGLPFFFLAGTDEEISLVCPTEYVPEETVAREDGWKGCRVEGVLDFSLVGILARLSGVLAESGISLFAVSTYNTDYILVKSRDFDRAMDALEAAGFDIA